MNEHQIKISSEWNVIKIEEQNNDALIWVEVLVIIKNNETNEIRSIINNYIIFDEDDCPHLYLWEEGNYSCDCNREILFKRAIGIEEIDFEAPCGESKYSVVLKNPKDNKIFYKEFE